MGQCHRGGREHSDQVMLDGVAGGSDSGRDLDFAIDGSQVVVDGARADDESFGDLRVGEPLGQEVQDFDFTGGQATGISGCWPGWWGWRG